MHKSCTCVPGFFMHSLQSPKLQEIGSPHTSSRSTDPSTLQYQEKERVKEFTMSQGWVYNIVVSCSQTITSLASTIWLH